MKTLAAVLGALVLLGASRPAEAYRCSRTGSELGPSLIWENRRIEWVADDALGQDITDDAAELAAIRAAFDAWNTPDCSDLEFVFSGTRANVQAGASAGGPYQNVVVFLSEGWPYERGVIAVTTNAYQPSTGVVYDADIELNDQHFKFVLADRGCDARPGTMDLQNTLTHEVGHIIGLDHPPSTRANEDVTMFASAPPCETGKRSLEQDDIDGLCAIYPKGQPNQQCFVPEQPSFLVVDEDDDLGGCSCASAPRARGVPAAILLLGFLLWRRRGASQPPMCAAISARDRTG